MKRIVLSLLMLGFIEAPQAQQVLSPQSVLGYPPGSRFSFHYKIVQYFESLARSESQRVKLERYGATNEGRPLLLVYISSADNIRNLDAIRQNNLKLAGVEPGAGELNGKNIVWLSYSVHGNEASSSEAAMQTAYELLTDARAEAWLQNTVVILDPCLNPDGRDRYANWYNSVVGRKMNSDPQSREHSEPWPGGRSNHYYFDLNRDWAWQTQAESHQRVQVYNRWLPQVHVDYHEQGFNEPYYFAPAAEPFHEVITPWQRSFQSQIGRNNARHFDQAGWLYFTKERFDLFYPSYGDTWPTYNGSIGMTYEQGGHSRGGLGVVTQDGDTLTLTDRVRHHTATGMSTVEIASKHAMELQRNFQQYFAATIANGSGSYKSFVLKAKGNENKLTAITELLKKNDITFGYAKAGQGRGFNYFSGKEEAFSIDNGDLVISTAQPHGVMAQVLFEPKSKLSDSVTYDITAWAVPYAYGVQAYAVKDKISAAAATAETKRPAVLQPAPAYGYIKSWACVQDARFLAACMKKGIKVRMTEKPFEVNGKIYNAGTLIFIKTSNNTVGNFDEAITKLAAENGVVLDAVQTGFMDKGVDFGSPDVKMLYAPRVAALTGEQSSSLGSGEVWHFFEQQLNYPVSMINANEVQRVDWRKYDVLVVPDGNYKSLFAKDGALKNWVEQGGKLIVMENAVAQLANADWGLTAKKDKDEADDKNDDYALITRYENRERDGVASNNPGSIFKVNIDMSHPLGFGYPDYYYTMKTDNNVYEFLKDGWNVGVIKKESKMAGFTGSKATQKLKDGVLFGELPMGGGAVVFLADDVLFRNFWENGKLLFCNAVLLVNQGNGFRL